jgi:hypothetical protein
MISWSLPCGRRWCDKLVQVRFWIEWVMVFLQSLFWLDLLPKLFPSGSKSCFFIWWGWSNWLRHCTDYFPWHLITCQSTSLNIDRIFLQVLQLPFDDLLQSALWSMMILSIWISQHKLGSGSSGWRHSRHLCFCWTCCQNCFHHGQSLASSTYEVFQIGWSCTDWFPWHLITCRSPNLKHCVKLITAGTSSRYLYIDIIFIQIWQPPSHDLLQSALWSKMMR